MADDRLSQLYRRFGPVIYERCRRLLRDAGAAEDATQETFLRIRRHLDRAPTDDEALAWIYRVATNHCLNELRNQKLRPEPVADPPDVAVEGFERLFLDQDLALRVLGRAPEKLRVAAYLHYCDGLDQDEVARVLGVSRRTVVSRLGEFRQLSRVLLGAEPVLSAAKVPS